ncbi:nitrogenase molybdenum-iron protein subunit beta [Hungatella sp. L12]|uniref:Nitrogenase molybdenum-iron protein subunit beta n=2 Tax=Hungatella hominis TaxID=2763050 RepID=A0ABR7HB06_9FIRM|nr:nitrogenase molybdenum-iron protein subunit beta [Hungatella hominis]
MKKRLEKKMEKRKREQIHRLLDLALDINGLEPRKQAITGSLPTAFFYFSGHTGWAEIQVHSDGWSTEDYPDVNMYADTYSLGRLTDVVRRLNTLKAESPGAATPRDSR